MSGNGSSKLVVSLLHLLSFFMDFLGAFEDQRIDFVCLLFSDTVRRRLHTYYLQKELLMPYYTTELKRTPNKQMEDIFIFVGVCVLACVRALFIHTLSFEQQHTLYCMLQYVSYNSVLRVALTLSGNYFLGLSVRSSAGTDWKF